MNLRNNRVIDELGERTGQILEQSREQDRLLDPQHEAIDAVAAELTEVTTIAIENMGTNLNFFVSIHAFLTSINDAFNAVGISCFKVFVLGVVTAFVKNVAVEYWNRLPSINHSSNLSQTRSPSVPSQATLPPATLQSELAAAPQTAESFNIMPHNSSTNSGETDSITDLINSFYIVIKYFFKTYFRE